MSLGVVGSLLLNNFLKETYSSRKLKIEEKIEKFLTKKVELGNYSGIRFLGVSLANTKIFDENEPYHEIKAGKVYVGIMPIKSFLNQRWIFKIKPDKAEINADKEFFKRENFYKKKKNSVKTKIKYDLNLKLTRYANLKLEDIGLETQVKGNLLYKSDSKQLVGKLKTNFEDKGTLKFKFNKDSNKDFFSFELFSNGINLDSSLYSFLNRKINVSEGNFKSNFKFYKSPTRTFCKGRFSLSKLNLNTSDLSETLKTDFINFLCKDGILKASSNSLNYGTLTSDFNLDIPLNKSINDIKLKGNIGYLNSLNPDIKLSARLPYWFDKRGINFGKVHSSFDLNRTQLSNLNFFRSKGIRGYITAKGELKGYINDPEILINFNVDYPNYKGIRIKEIWEGEIKNDNDEYLLNMKNRYSPIPSFLSIKFDSKIKLENLIFSRVFNTNRGSLNIAKENESYIWKANNFPFDELELSFGDNEYNRIKGIINGEGSISSDQSYLKGRLAWSLGEYRNIKFANSLFDFTFKDQSLYLNSSLYPIDGGMIDIEFDTNKNKFLNANFSNISTSWSILTAVDIFNFDNKKEEIPTGKAKVLNDLQIKKEDMSFKEKIKYIKEFKEDNNLLEDKLILKSYLSKFESRYDAQLIIEGDDLQSYKVKTKLDGYLNVNNFDTKKNREEFSIDLEGGLIKGKGSLNINKFPISAINIFLNKPKDFQGGLDINLFYDLDSKYISSNISSGNTFIKDNQIIFDKGDFEYSNSIFDINLSLLVNDSKKPITIKGTIPLRKNDNLDLRLIGDEKFIELIDFFSDEYFSFNKGDVNLRMLIKGDINKPLLNGFVFIKDSEIDFYTNIIKNINSVIIFDFDHLEIKNFEAIDANSGNIFIKGALPFNAKGFSEDNDISLITDKFKINSKNIQFLVDSNLKISGSFGNPIIGGNLSLNNGFVNFNTPVENKNNKIKQKITAKNWPELYWENDKNIEIISNETILNSIFLGETLPTYLENLSFNNLKLKLGPEFRLQYSEIISAYLDTKLDLNINGSVRDDLNARGLIYLKKGKANLYTTPFKLDKNKDNYILFASRSGVVPFINFSLVSKVPDSIIPINENNQDLNISGDLNADSNSKGFGAFGIGNTRLIKIEASYEGFLDQLSFEDENKRIQLRSTPSYNRSQIIGLIGGNSANLINRAFISQFNNADAFSERFQLSLYPAIIENNDSLNNIFSNENLDIKNDQESTSSEVLSSQAWVAEVGLDITDSINFAVQAIPGRDELPPLGILTFQASPNLELLGSFDSSGDWQSQLQLFFRY